MQSGILNPKTKMERAAYINMHLADTLLTESHGTSFFQIWKQRDLAPTLGLPTARTYNEILTGFEPARELAFPGGKMQIRVQSTGMAQQTCFRIFTTADLQIGEAAKRRTLWISMRKRLPRGPSWGV